MSEKNLGWRKRTTIRRRKKYVDPLRGITSMVKAATKRLVDDGKLEPTSFRETQKALLPKKP